LLPNTLDDYLLNSNLILKFINNEIGKKLKYIVIGSAAEYGITGDPVINVNKTSPNPRNLYGLSKLHQTLLAEYYKEHFGIDIIVFRLFNIISPFLPNRSFIGSLISAIVKGSNGIIQVNNGKIQRDFLDLRDFVNLVKNAINKPTIKQTIFNVGNGYNVNYQEVIALAFNLLKKYNLPIPTYKDLDKTEIFSKSVCNIDDTKKVFDWEPNYSLKDSLEWCLKENKLIK
jgi:nucleoside-diphosphate-sugar epimerase